ncbi:MAG TPA: MlaD family protein [Chitinophagaceae bacterium]|nr:MAG: organic solvent ABC transporter perimplasmic protein [Bacteroidetes bacterium OLB11]HMN33015.1 MlaD family protein [Chitinophagaceae bacterium]
MKFNKEIKLGIIGILSIVMFIFGYNFLKGTGIFSSTKTIKAEYDNVQGLTPASYVQLQGFNVGAVSSIELSKTNPGKVIVEMNVDKNIQIPIDSKAQIVSLDLLGTKAISIIKGNSTNFIKNEAILQGDIELGTIESLGSSLTPAIDDAHTVISNLDNTVKNINQILDLQTQNNLKDAVANLNKTMKDFSQFANELNAQKSKISSVLTNLNSFSSNLNNNNNHINKILQNAEATTNNLSKVNFDQTMNELKSTLSNLQTTLNKINNGNGSMALLLNDDKLYKNLKNTLATANNLLYDINARPSRYINVNLIGKKNKNECPPQPAPNAND